MMFELHMEGKVIGSGNFDDLKSMTQNIEVEFAIYQIFKSKINMVPLDEAQVVEKKEIKIASRNVDISPKYLSYRDAERAANMRIRGKILKRIWKELHTTEQHLHVSLEIFDDASSEKEYNEKMSRIKPIRQYVKNTF